MLDNGEVRVFSRNLEDNTVKYPDIVTTFKAHLKPGVRSVVLDAEAVAFDRETKKILPFQVLSTRAKKGVSAEDVKVQVRLPVAACAAAARNRMRQADCAWFQVCLFAFDCLYADGRTLLREPLSERRRLLYACCNETEGELQFAKERTRCSACVSRCKLATERLTRAHAAAATLRSSPSSSMTPSLQTRRVRAASEAAACAPR